MTPKKHTVRTYLKEISVSNYDTTLIFGGGIITYFNLETNEIWRDGCIDKDTPFGYKLESEEYLDFVKVSIKLLNTMYEQGTWCCYKFQHILEIVQRCFVKNSQ